MYHQFFIEADEKSRTASFLFGGRSPCVRKSVIGENPVGRLPQLSSHISNKTIKAQNENRMAKNAGTNGGTL